MGPFLPPQLLSLSFRPGFRGVSDSPAIPTVLSWSSARADFDGRIDSYSDRSGSPELSEISEETAFFAFLLFDSFATRTTVVGEQPVGFNTHGSSRAIPVSVNNQ